MRLAQITQEHFNKLSPAQAERLSLLLEEMGEVQQVIGKIQRHGYESKNPDDPLGEQWRATNRMLLEKELGHVAYALALMIATFDVNPEAIERSTKIKSSSVIAYLHHQKEEDIEQCR